MLRKPIYNRSFAYETIKDRLPLIVTRIVDFLARHRARIAQEQGGVNVRHRIGVPMLF
jgi:hypothetical protein